MRRTIMLLTVAVMMAVMMVASSMPLFAQGRGEGPTPNGHNCGGTSSFDSINDPEYDGGKDYGEFVGDYASSGEDVTSLLPANCVPQGTWPPRHEGKEGR